MHLKKLLKIDDGSSSDPENGFIVVTQVGSQTFGIVVDGVFHTEEIVVKPMSTKLRHIDMFSGNTILGDGAVIMIIDPNGIAKALGASGAASHEIADENAASRASAAEQLTSLLVFRAGTNQPKAVPLGLVTRLEEIACDKIELSNGRYMVQYRDQLMPLVQMAGVNVQTSGSQPILVFADDRRSMGLVVDEIVDIVEERLNIEVGGSPGRHSRLRRDQGPGHRGDRRRPLPADGVPRLVHPQGDDARRPRRNRCCWSTIARSSATCWRRCSRPPATRCGWRPTPRRA